MSTNARFRGAKNLVDKRAPSFVYKVFDKRDGVAFV